jgi:hypothetical protein
MQVKGTEASYSAWKAPNFRNVFESRSDISQPFARLRSLRNFSLSEWRLRAHARPFPQLFTGRHEPTRWRIHVPCGPGGPVRNPHAPTRSYSSCATRRLNIETHSRSQRFQRGIGIVERKTARHSALGQICTHDYDAARRISAVCFAIMRHSSPAYPKFLAARKTFEKPF